MGSRAVQVCVLDTGIDYNHPDIAANMWINPVEAAGAGATAANGYKNAGRRQQRYSCLRLYQLLSCVLLLENSSNASLDSVQDAGFLLCFCAEMCAATCLHFPVCLLPTCVWC